MQRQSLGGSPLSPSLSHDDDTISTKSPSKPRRFSIPSPSPSLSPLQHKFIHAIPLLILFCFLVLFLFSHELDLAQFKGFRRMMTKGSESPYDE